MAGAGVAWPVETVRIVPIDFAEQRSRAPYPRQARELVDGRDEECREPPVDRLVNREDRQRHLARERAPPVYATDAEVSRLILARQQHERIAGEARATPGTDFERNRRGLTRVVPERNDLSL